MSTSDPLGMPGLLLSGTVGSTAHGLSTPSSDIDTLGVFAASALDISGLDWHSSHESVVVHEPDITFHEARKYLKLVLGANPTALELLYLDDYQVKTDLGSELISIRDKLLDPRRVRDAYSGYAKSQIARFERNARSGKVERKTARHTLRLVEQGVRLLTEGTFSIRVENPQRYFDLDEMEYSDVVEYLLKEFNLLSGIEPESAPLIFNRRAAVDWLMEVRQTFL